VSSMNISRSERSWAPIFEGTAETMPPCPTPTLTMSLMYCGRERSQYAWTTRSTATHASARRWPRKNLSMPTRPPLTNGNTSQLTRSGGRQSSRSAFPRCSVFWPLGGTLGPRYKTATRSRGPDLRGTGAVLYSYSFWK